LAKYGVGGAAVWVRQSFASVNQASGAAVAAAADGSAYVTGWFDGVVAFGANTLTTAGSGDCLLVKYDSAGNVLWARRVGGLGEDSGWCITVDAQGSVLLGGTFTGPAAFGGIALNGSGSREFFIAKSDSQGNFLWARRIVGVGPGRLYDDFVTRLGIAADSQGNACLAGAFEQAAPGGFVSKYDATGSIVWSRSLPGAASSVAADALGNVYFGGRFTGSFSLDGQSVTSAGGLDVFVFKLNSSGTAIWAKQAGFVFDDICNGVAVDPAGNVVLAGTFRDTTRFDTNIISGNGDDVFIAKLGNETVPLQPVIQAQPQSQSVSPGGTATFGVVATGAPLLQFQWRFNGTNIVWGTNALLTITNTLLANAGSYDVVVTNVAGSVTSVVATLTVVPGTPSFSDNFSDRGIMIGFTNFVTGNNTLNTPEPGEPDHADRKGAHSAWLTWTAPDNGTCVMDTLGSSFDTVLAVYTGAVVSNLALVAANDDVTPGTLQSRVAFSAVAGVAYQIAVDGYGVTDVGNIVFHMSFSNAAPIITVQPQSRSVVAGSNTTFSVTALGLPTLTYQWRINGTNLAGATAASYAINNVQPPNEGGYSVVVENTFGSITSSVATLLVLLRPAVTAQPQSQTVTAGDATMFNVIASGTPPLSYQWRFNGADIGGAFAANLMINNTQPAQAGGYSVVVSNPYGVATSAVATLTVNFSLTVLTNGNGSVSRSPDLLNYTPNSVVNVTATPGPGAFFINWSGDAGGASNPLAVTMTSNRVITANFAATSLTLGTQGPGTIAKSPERAFYSVGEEVMLTGIPGRWHAFARWADGPSANPRVITIGPSNSYTAIFTPTQSLETLTFGGVMRTAPVGMPAVFVEGVFIVDGAVTNFDAARVEIQSTFANEAILFTLDDTTPGLASTFYESPFTVRQTSTVRAVAFNVDLTQAVDSDPVVVVIVPSHSLDAGTAGGGTVSRAPDAERYPAGGVVTLTATPSEGWSFVQWLGDASGTNPAANVALNRDKCMEAVFGTPLNTSALGSGSVVVNPAAGILPYGTVVRLTALPQAGNYFAFWGGAGSGTNNPLSFPVTSAQPTVTAVFQPLSAGQVALTVLPNGRGSVTSNPRGSRFPSGQSVSLTAIADADQEFLGWTGDGTGTTTNLTVALTRSKVITAIFTQRPRLSLGPCLGGWREDGFQLTLTGEFDGHYRIEQSSGLTDWNTLANFTNTYGIWQMMDTTATNDTTRFYRAVEEP
jgi:hypothetical protein